MCEMITNIPEVLIIYYGDCTGEPKEYQGIFR